MPYCSNCGHEISAEALACPQCGHPGPAAGVVTAEPGVAYAAWWERLVAFIIDNIVVAIPANIFMAIAGIGNYDVDRRIQFDPTTGEIVNAGGAVGSLFSSFVVAQVMMVIYRALMDGNVRGQTLGKMAMKIAVRDLKTMEPIGPVRAAARWTVAAVLFLLAYVPGVIDGLFPLWDRQRQTLHDKAISTIVVKVA